MWGNDPDGVDDTYIQMNQGVTIPAGTTYLRFNHAYGFDDNSNIMLYDGGVLEYSLDDGATWQDAGPLITDNGYNGTIVSYTDNPLAGRSAFVAESNGYISTRVNLSSLAGHTVSFRFRIGADDNTLHSYDAQSDYGWFIDDIRIYTCGTSQTSTPVPTSTPAPTPTPSPTPKSGDKAVLSILTRHVGTFSASADATIMMGYPDKNFGSEKDMYIGYQITPTINAQTMLSLIKFNLSALPKNTQILNATVQIYIRGSYDYENTIRKVVAYRASADWVENKVTWNNRPTYSETAGTLNSNSSIQGWASMDITKLVRGWISGSTPNYGLVFSAPDSNSTVPSFRIISTRESQYAARLVLIYSPSSAGLNIPAAQVTPWDGQPALSIFETLTGQLPDPSLINICQDGMTEECLNLK